MPTISRLLPPPPVTLTVAFSLSFCWFAIAEDTSRRTDAPNSPADAIQPANGESKRDVEKDSKSTPNKTQIQTEKESSGFDTNLGSLADAPDTASVTKAKLALQAAAIHRKFGAAEHGNLWEFDLADQALKSAAEMIAQAKMPRSQISMALISDRQAEIDAMRNSASTTFFGQFPLVRAFGLWPEKDEEFEIHSYARKGEARRRAVYGALIQIAKTASSGPLHVLILVPGNTVDERKLSPLGRLADSQVHEAFSTTPNITVHPGALRTFVDPMPRWNSPDSAFDPICREFLRRIDSGKEPRSVMLVMLREFVDDNGDGHWIQAQQRTYEANTLEKAAGKPDSLEADKVKIVESLTHDRSRFNNLTMGAIVVLFIVSLGAHRILTYFALSSAGDWQRWFAIPSSGFLIGLGLTHFIMLAMNRWLPEPQSDALNAAWWPCTAGALSLILPAGIFRLGAGSIGRYFPGLSCHSRWGIAFVPVALGVSAAWIRPTCYAVGFHSVEIVLLLAIAGSLIVYFFGRAVDVADEFPVGLTPISVVLSLLFGAGAFMASAMMLAIVTGIAVLTAAIQMWVISLKTASSGPAEEISAAPELNWGTPRTNDQLRMALNAPKYLPPRAIKQLESLSLEQTRWIGLSGPATAGKSAAAQHLIDRIHSQYPEIQILAGHCSKNAPPYQPFREALAELGASAGIIASSARGGEVNTIFERLADEFIPFWDLFSVGDDDAGKEISRHELLEGVLNALRKLTQRRPAVLFLDDIHWMDEGSTALLEHIRKNFPPDSDHPLALILTSCDAAAFENLELTETVITLTPPTAGEQVYFLQRSFGIEQATAKHLVKSLGVISQESDSMFWLIRAVGELVTDDALIASPRGFQLREFYLKNKQLPVPDEMRARLGASLRASGQYLPVIECAALLGEKFRVNDVADCLKMDRLQLLQILRHLDQELQLVRDLARDQDCYAFSSVFMLEIVRDELGVTRRDSRGPRQLSKIARELHARIAAVLASRTPRTPQLVYDLAHHYHAAGTACAPQCVDHCIAAADVARSHYAFRAAREYLAMAKESALITRRSVELTEKLKQIRNDESTTNLSLQEQLLS